MQLLARNRNFRLLFSASAVSNLGDGISALAFPWLATLITHDPLLIAMVAAATRLPWLLFAIPAGVLTDRTDRRRLMLQADIARTALTCGVVALVLAAPPLPLNAAPTTAIWLISLLSLAAFLLGTAEVIRDNAAQTVLPSVVHADDLERANGQLWSIEQIMGQFIGPPLAGILIALAAPIPFTFNALCFALAAACLWTVTLLPRPTAKLPDGIFAQMHEGIIWLFNTPLILKLAVMLGALNMTAVMCLTVLVLFSQEVLGLSAAGHGLLLTAGAAGGVAGGMIGPLIAARLGGQTTVRLSLLLFPLPYALIFLAPNPALVAVALFVETFAGMTWNVVTVSLRQRMIPDALLGRVNSVYRFFGWGVMPIGAMLGGALVTLAEPSLGREAALRLPYALASLSMIGTLIYGLMFLRFDTKA
ncbi:MFS transporter [Actibacterium lipolyticum]|uniref:Enterobactin exporter EntS n=1 Tax=Actibacterium lipolyticum TaxID=1524263 RepID=A0A238KUQ7_9RHOB|nr:MFS transporter [Actibacterium lipolyticum]SMX46331.1 enterobactin exporter EntS [Actibacterium lipolyticum]